MAGRGTAAREEVCVLAPESAENRYTYAGESIVVK
jgi:hypothetical protein